SYENGFPRVTETCFQKETRRSWVKSQIFTAWLEVSTLSGAFLDRTSEQDAPIPKEISDYTKAFGPRPFSARSSWWYHPGAPQSLQKWNGHRITRSHSTARCLGRRGPDGP